MTIERVTAVEVWRMRREAETIEVVPATNVQAAMDIPTITDIKEPRYHI